MDPKRADAIWKEIVRVTAAEKLTRKEGEYTLREFIEMVKADTGTTIKRSTARDRLDALVAAGKLAKRRVYLDDIRAYVSLYSPAEE